MTAEVAFFVRDKDRFVPTGQGISPWNAKALNGVALAGLAASMVGTVPTRTDMHVARLTIDILGAVPIEPLVPEVRVLRDGGRVQLVEIGLCAGDRTWVRATALRVRQTASPTNLAELTRLQPEAYATISDPFKVDWVETITAEGDFQSPGPASVWLRFLGRVVAGEPLGDLERMAMVSDWGSGMSSLVSPKDYTFANLDIALHLTRMPRGEWLLMDAVSESAGNGMAIAMSRLGDREGMIGTALQTVFVAQR
jgi:acyl-CoA thioesterase